MDIWTFFTCIGIDYLKSNAVLSFIAPNNWVSNSGDKLAKNIKGIKPIVVLDNALKIIGKYDINQHIQADIAEESAQDTQPTIVISQSYV